MDRAAMLNEETNTTGDIASASRNDSEKTLRFTWTAVALDSHPLTSLIRELFSSMCGISGIWERSGCSLQDLERRVSAMTQTLSHRGPDNSGVC
jgi:hypothetical protein